MKYIILVGMMLLTGCGGKDGVNGANGAPGMTIASTRYCSFVSSGLLFHYQFTKYSTGDAFVNCGVSDNIGTYSGSRVYMSSQVGATSGGCSVTDDIDSPYAGGYWTFQVSGLTAAVTYNDSGSASDDLTHVFTSSECSDFTP